MGFIDKLREKSFKRELARAKKEKMKVKAKAKELVKIELMQKAIRRARGNKGLNKLEKALLKKKVDKLAKRKEETKKALKIASKGALKIGKEAFKFIFIGPNKKKSKR